MGRPTVQVANPKIAFVKKYALRTLTTKGLNPMSQVEGNPSFTWENGHVRKRPRGRTPSLDFTVINVQIDRISETTSYLKTQPPNTNIKVSDSN